MSKEYMHKWLEEDAVRYDLPTEEIIQQLAEDNENLQAELKAKDEALEKYGSHRTLCFSTWGECNCGFEQALKGESDG